MRDWILKGFYTKGMHMTIEEKVAVLESRIRRQRLGMTGMCLGFSVALFLGMAQQAPKEMTLESLTIMKDGKPRIAMGTNEKDGGVGIAILDINGKARIAMGSDPKGESGMVVMDENESPRIVLGTGVAGAGIVLMGAPLVELPAQK